MHIEGGERTQIPWLATMLSSVQCTCINCNLNVHVIYKAYFNTDKRWYFPLRRTHRPPTSSYELNNNCSYRPCFFLNTSLKLKCNLKGHDMHYNQEIVLHCNVCAYFLLFVCFLFCFCFLFTCRRVAHIDLYFFQLIPFLYMHRLS